MSIPQFTFSAQDNGRSISGQSLVLVTAFMVMLFGFAALSLDGGRLYLNKKKLQNATDCAALAELSSFHPKIPVIRIT